MNLFSVRKNITEVKGTIQVDGSLGEWSGEQVDVSSYLLNGEMLPPWYRLFRNIYCLVQPFIPINGQRTTNWSKFNLYVHVYLTILSYLSGTTNSNTWLWITARILKIRSLVCTRTKSRDLGGKPSWTVQTSTANGITLKVKISRQIMGLKIFTLFDRRLPSEVRFAASSSI